MYDVYSMNYEEYPLLSVQPSFGAARSRGERKTFSFTQLQHHDEGNPGRNGGPGGYGEPAGTD
jgi:hypothetical protein